VAQQLVDPHGDLVAEGGGQGVLAMRAAGDGRVGRAFGKIGHRREQFPDLAEKDRMRLAQHQQVAGLGDVLGRRAPMHPTAVRLADHAAELPDQRHDGVAGACEALVDALAVEQRELRLGSDRLGCFGGDDAQLGLRPCQSGLDVEPGLPAVFQPVERTDAGFADARGGRQGI
jgi:hypothetical protein